MKNKILLIIPTRDRNQKHKEVYEAIKATSSEVDILFGLDDDDQHKYERIEDEIVKYEVNPRMRMLPTLNHLAVKYAPEYKYVAFMGDDHRPRTVGWDKAFMENLGDLGIGYGDDLIQHEAMCTAVIMTSNIIETLGCMHPSRLIHLIADIFWKEMGEAAEILHYMPNIIIEHLHFTVGKAEKDEIYEEVNAGSMYWHDQQAYEEYKNSGKFQADLSRIISLKDSL